MASRVDKDAVRCNTNSEINLTNALPFSESLIKFRARDSLKSFLLHLATFVEESRTRKYHVVLHARKREQRHLRPVGTLMTITLYHIRVYITACRRIYCALIDNITNMNGINYNQCAKIHLSVIIVCY